MPQLWRIILGGSLLLAAFAGAACLSRAGAREPFVITWNYDTSGYLETCGCSAHQLGGLTRRAAKLAGLRAKQPVLALEGAHIVEDAGGFQLYKGETIVQALNLMQYGALVLGVREAQQGAAGLRELTAQAKFPCVCANLLVDGQPWPAPSAVVEVAGARVGITGVSQPEYVSFKLPEGVGFSDPAQALGEALRDLRGKADLRVVCLEGEETWIEGMLAQFRDQAELFLTGDRDPATANYMFTSDPPRLNNWSLGKYLGLVTVDPLGTGFSFSGTNLPIEDTLTQDAAVKNLLDNVYRPQLKERFFSQFKQDLSQVYLPPDYCADCHKKEYDAYMQSRHAGALNTLDGVGQLYNPDCMKCHVVYDAKLDELHALNCVSCHSNITVDHVDAALNGKVQPPNPAVAAYTYEWCAQCHDEQNSLPFREHWPQYVKRIYHGGDMSAAKQAAEAMGLDLDAPLEEGTGAH